ncbi:hypothetical protein B0H10DRAFT_2020820 [Mycena sp. CBHHK59/15]|nr:hypothetical protein B0H10DRAFT_2020820 [Mycena sp. CBHHK59/15]
MAPSIYVVENAVVFQTFHPSYKARLPPIRDVDWVEIHASTVLRTVLQTLGDGILYDAVTRLLLQRVPSADMEMHTNLRTVLLQSLTLQHILQSTGRSIPARHRKPAANILETAVGALSRRIDDDTVFAWVADAFGPLVDAALEVYQSAEKTAVKRKPDWYWQEVDERPVSKRQNSSIFNSSALDS